MEIYRIYKTLNTGNNGIIWEETSYVGEEKLIKKILISLRNCKNTKFCMKLEN